MSDSEKSKSWKERRQSIKHKWAVPFVYFEWKCEQLSVLLKRWALLDICGHVGRFGVLVSIIVGLCVYVMEADERRMQAESERQQAVDQRKAKHYQAWQVIIASQGQQSSGGRTDALQDLNRDDVSLAGIDISGARLPELNLAGADLVGANLADVIATDANFAGADFRSANLTGADLRGANLIGADLSDANLARANLRSYIINDPPRYTNLSRAKLNRANFSKADLDYTNLSGAVLYDANFAEATLEGAKLSDAIFGNAPSALRLYGDNTNLAKADLSWATLSNISGWEYIKSIELANIHCVKNAPSGFIEWAEEHGAVSVNFLGVWRNYIRENRLEQTKEKQ